MDAENGKSVDWRWLKMFELYVEYKLVLKFRPRVVSDRICNQIEIYKQVEQVDS